MVNFLSDLLGSRDLFDRTFFFSLAPVKQSTLFVMVKPLLILSQCSLVRPLMKIDCNRTECNIKNMVQIYKRNTPPSSGERSEVN